MPVILLRIFIALINKDRKISWLYLYKIHARIQGELFPRHQYSSNSATHGLIITRWKVTCYYLRGTYDLLVYFTWTVSSFESQLAKSFRALFEHVRGVVYRGEAAVHDFRRHRRIGQQQTRSKILVLLSGIWKLDTLVI